MYYEPQRGHGLPHDPFKAIIAPRPIGWISTVDTAGQTNLAPYSFFNGVSGKPPMVMFCSEGYKDSIRNAEATREFVTNLVTRSLADAMNATSAPFDADVCEFAKAGLTKAQCHVVSAPRVAEARAALECKVTEIIRPRDTTGERGERWMAIGEVVGVHIDDTLLNDGMFDIEAARTLSRCGYFDYAEVVGVFELRRPTAN